MNKVILFLWFGDQKPPYIQWTLENFRKMNPGWEVRYVEYTNSQIENYKEQNDPVLTTSMTNLVLKYNNHVYNSLSDKYRRIYLDEHKDELVIYCDLDCFPIAPFDNFITTKENNFPNWVLKLSGQKVNRTRNIGYWTFNNSKVFQTIQDSWCMTNNNIIIFTDRFIQIHKEFCANDDAIIKDAIFMNKTKISQYLNRSKAFHEMKIELGDNFCLPQFTPIEHYYSRERNRLNIGLEGQI